MAAQSILWIALPRGVKGTTLQLSVYISPQLAPATKKLTADFQHWPAVLSGLSFKVGFAGGPAQPLPATPSADSEPVDPDLWIQIIPSATTVEPFVFKDFSPQLVRSFPARRIRQHLEGVYKQIAETSPTTFPSLANGSFLRTALIDPLRSVTQGVEDRDKQLTAILHAQDQQTGKPRRALRASDTPFGSTPAQQLLSDYFQLYRFYYRPAAREPWGPLAPAKVPGRPKPIAPDFHRMIALLGDYPKLLRLLGLVIDLDVQLGKLADVPAASTLQVHVLPGAPAGSIRPKTKYLLSPTHFVAAPRQGGSLLSNGMLALNQADWFDLHQLDLDGAALKAADFATNMASVLLPKNKTYKTQSTASLPSLRSGGLTVGALDRAARLVQHFDDALGKSTTLGNATELDADDLVRGFRLDVWDSNSKRWHSLHERHGTYAFAADADHPATTIERDDEGYVKAASPTSTPGDASKDLYLHEALFGWDGWSLAAPRPGRLIRHERESPPGVHPDQIGDKDPDTATPLDASFRAKPGSLPKLRFGQRYRVRARAVDLAGNSLPPDSSEDVLAIPPKAPAAQPQGVPYARFEPVASPALLRRYADTDGESLERVVIRSDIKPFETPAAYLTSPVVGPALAGKPYSYREFSERHVVPSKTSQLLAELHGRFDAAFGAAVDPAAVLKQYDVARREKATLADAPGYQVGPGEAPLLDANDFSLPYLPDPISAGVSFDPLPGDAVHPRTVAWTGSWPNLAPFRLRLEGGSGAPVPAPGVLTIRLPQAEVIRIRYSSFVDAAVLDTDLLAIWLLVSAQKRADPAFRKQVADGLNWLVTPPRTLELVHAVQHPLAKPTIDKPTLVRTLGQTFVAFDRESAVLSHARSTGRLDVLADWEEPIDRLTEPKPDEHVPGKGHVCGFTLERSEARALLKKTDKPRVGRTPPQHRAVHEFGDTKHRVVRYRAVATTRFREFFPPEITGKPENITQVGEATELVVLSSARPAAPALRYAVPTFGWTEAKLRQGVTRTRQGGGVRVYLDRPWWSSGAGELLGVILREPTPARVLPSPTDRLKSYVTELGLDPLWASDTPKPTLTPADFPRAVQSTPKGLSLEELKGATVGVAGHLPEFDDQRGLWYCDIDISHGSSYFPFVRLALARFQPNSLPNAHLSRIVLSDFAQLVADRSATITFPAANQALVQLSGPVGVGRLSKDTVIKDTAPIPHLNRSRVVRVTVQSRDPKVKSTTDPLGWLKVSETLIGLKSKSGPTVTWEGTVPIPAGVRGKKTHRLLIAEHEVFLTDPDTKERVIGSKIAAIDAERPVRERVVYADEVIL